MSDRFLKSQQPHLEQPTRRSFPMRAGRVSDHSIRALTEPDSHTHFQASIHSQSPQSQSHCQGFNMPRKGSIQGLGSELNELRVLLRDMVDIIRDHESYTKMSLGRMKTEYSSRISHLEKNVSRTVAADKRANGKYQDNLRVESLKKELMSYVQQQVQETVVREVKEVEDNLSDIILKKMDDVQEAQVEYFHEFKQDMTRRMSHEIESRYQICGEQMKRYLTNQIWKGMEKKFAERKRDLSPERGTKLQEEVQFLRDDVTRLDEHALRLSDSFSLSLQNVNDQFSRITENKVSAIECRIDVMEEGLENLRHHVTENFFGMKELLQKIMGRVEERQHVWQKESPESYSERLERKDTSSDCGASDVLNVSKLLDLNPNRHHEDTSLYL